jgi:hypothetical protein
MADNRTISRLEAEGYPWIGCQCCKGTVWVPFKMLRERIPMLSAMTLDQLGAKMRCDKCGKRPERYYPANQSDAPRVRSKLLDVLSLIASATAIAAPRPGNAETASGNRVCFDPIGQRDERRRDQRAQSGAADLGDANHFKGLARLTLRSNFGKALISGFSGSPPNIPTTTCAPPTIFLRAKFSTRPKSSGASGLGSALLNIIEIALQVTNASLFRASSWLHGRSSITEEI